MTISSPVERSRPQCVRGKPGESAQEGALRSRARSGGQIRLDRGTSSDAQPSFPRTERLVLARFFAPLDPESAARYAKEGLAVESLDLRQFRIGTLRRLLHLVRSHEIEVVHWNFYHPLFNGYLWWVSVLSPRVQHFYTDHISRPRDEPATRRWGRLKRLLKGALYSRYRRVLCVSDYVLGRSRELPWIRSQRIHHFINTDRFRPDSAVRRDVRQALGVNDEFVVIAVAYLIKDKGIDVAVRAIAALPERVMLWVVGDGPELGNLQTLARSLGLERRLRLLGPRARWSHSCRGRIVSSARRYGPRPLDWSTSRPWHAACQSWPAGSAAFPNSSGTKRRVCYLRPAITMNWPSDSWAYCRTSSSGAFWASGRAARPSSASRSRVRSTHISGSIGQNKKTVSFKPFPWTESMFRRMLERPPRGGGPPTPRTAWKPSPANAPAAQLAPVAPSTTAKRRGSGRPLGTVTV